MKRLNDIQQIPSPLPYLLLTLIFFFFVIFLHLFIDFLFRILIQHARTLIYSVCISTPINLKSTITFLRSYVASYPINCQL